MIQEKDFLYRVPVKNALVTAPGKQVRNPEILVDLEGGKFMHGNILDANSTNKLIDQSVKDAIDNSIENGNYVTRDLLEAETSARTKSDEDLNTKIKAEQTRAEGKEKEISDKLAIVDGDSSTEGSFRKAIADVIAAAPEDLDTLKEIADKLAGNDDLHTALNQAITEKADASALANEVARATGAENDLRTAIDTKADATALSNYVLTTALNQQIDTLNTAISAKQDAGNYIPYERVNDNVNNKTYVMKHNEGILFKSGSGNVSIKDGEILIENTVDRKLAVTSGFIWLLETTDDREKLLFELNENGLRLCNGDDNHVLTSYGSTIDIREYARRSELPTTATKESLGVVKVGDGLNVTDGTISVDTTVLPAVPTNVSQLTNDSNFITAADADSKYALSATADSLRVGLSKKQNKITVNSVDVTDIETADITRLRTIVIELIDALTTSGLIRQNSNLE